MCSNPNFSDIIHINSLSDDIAALFLSDECSDVTLEVQGKYFRAHKVILAARSQYFRALLFGGMKESTQTQISILVPNVIAFEALLRYIYTGRLCLTQFDEELILDILGLAHQYGFINLENAICEYFIVTLSPHNVFSIYDASRLYQLHKLTGKCKSYIDHNIVSDFSTNANGFMQLSPEGLVEIIQRDSFYAPELEIFNIVQDWGITNNMNGSPQMEQLLQAVRFELMTLQELFSVIRPSGIVNCEKILDAIENQTTLRNYQLPHRGHLRFDSNMAVSCIGPQIVHSQPENEKIDENGIIIKLSSQCIVNFIRMFLGDKSTANSYYIEASVDEKDWVMIIDHSMYTCRSWQQLYFEPRVVNFIKIVGTSNLSNYVLHIDFFEIKYSTDSFNLINGMIMPVVRNVATTNEGAAVIEGICRIQNSVLDENILYDWNYGYICHPIGNGSIIIQLGQPYMIESMRILLWDRDDRTYRYYVEVSVDKENWQIVWDKKDEESWSWQSICFQVRPVLFIRIVGTHNTANEVFHLVHIECPLIHRNISQETQHQFVEQIPIIRENMIDNSGPSVFDNIDRIIV